MKRIITFLLALFTSTTFACGGGEWYDVLDFYSLFMQTNISTRAYYPFLRDANSVFYGEYDYYTENKEKVYPQGNINLWKEILPNWDTATIEKAVYGKDFNWADKNSKLEKRVKIYIDFAKKCSNAYAYRMNKGSWEYEEILKEHPVDADALLNEAKALLAKEKNEQLKARYNYQFIRILHYAERWQEAIVFYQDHVENTMPKNEIYYYSTDQVAGCHYSMKRYDYAAYLYTKIFAKSVDRKKSAFLSYNFCVKNEEDGRNYIEEGAEALEDEKNFLTITSLRNFTNEIDNLQNFINLDAADTRIELLFARALNNVEAEVLPKRIGVANNKLPSLTNQKHSQLLAIAQQQLANPKVKNKDYWQLASSYLAFINGDINTAKAGLANVKTLTKQQKILAIIYEVSSWDTITAENEKYITTILNNYPKLDNMYGSTEDDIRHFILDKIAHVYYKNKQLAKAFLVHNKIEATAYISSLELLNALETFYYKKNKSSYEKMLILNKIGKTYFVDYINHQKGVYYLYHAQPEQALVFFNKSNGISEGFAVPNTVFSNNIKECFNCKVEDVMDDQVYQASVFNFIKPEFTRKELAIYLIKLQGLTSNKTQWKAKLANYLLGNYYFNVSNTGYYRGVLSGNYNCCDYDYVDYANKNYSKQKIGEEIIASKKGYNLSDITSFDKRYFNVSTTAKTYYQKVIALSKDKELNARCLYLMAKCELNDFYNNGSENTFTIDTKYAELNLPRYQSFKTLKEDYANTKFHNMIIRECSYFRYYTEMN